MNERWSEESPVLYDLVCYIQDEMVADLMPGYGNPDEFKSDSNGNLHLVYSRSSEFQSIFAASREAFRRTFDLEEHCCTICTRNLLGDKFFFLSGCEHYFCLECLQETVVQRINSG